MSNPVDALKSINLSSFATDEERKLAVDEAHALLSRIESPWETTFRLFFAVPTQIPVLKTAVDLCLFKNWMESKDGSKSSAEELLSLVDCDSKLFKRILHQLGASNIVWIDSSGLYEMTPFSQSLANEGIEQSIDYLYHYTFPPAFHLPTFLNANGYQDPSGNDNDCFKHWSGDSFFNYHAKTPGVNSKFNAFMKATGTKRGTFSEIYPCDDLSCSTNDGLIVDIGGNIGHDLRAFRDRYPDAAGRLVLQDLPEVIENAMTMPWAPSIEMQKYDFFTPQTVIGAKVYLLHTVLHDWPDADVVRILENLKPALMKNYSKLLIHEIVVNEIRPSLQSTSRDFVMLVLNSGLESEFGQKWFTRGSGELTNIGTENQWRTLIESVGLKIIQIHRSSLYPESVIETELA